MIENSKALHVEHISLPSEYHRIGDLRKAMPAYRNFLKCRIHIDEHIHQSDNSIAFMQT